MEISSGRIFSTHTLGCGGDRPFVRKKIQQTNVEVTHSTCRSITQHCNDQEQSWLVYFHAPIQNGTHELIRGCKKSHSSVNRTCTMEALFQKHKTAQSGLIKAPSGTVFYQQQTAEKNLSQGKHTSLVHFS